MIFPQFYCVQQLFDSTAITDIPGTVRRELLSLDLASRIRPGQRVGITVGSRGLAHRVEIVATVVQFLRELGLVPFVLPAMGSHGGATAEGQTRLLASLGITEASVHAPVVSNMDVVRIGRLKSGAEVLVAKDALEADHIVVINRVKPHTAFRAPIESGLCKMLAVGCGKHQGAFLMHKYGLAENILPAAEVILGCLSVLFGLALVDNPVEGLHTIRAVGPEAIPSVDRELLELARSNLPRIPLDDLDILIVDEMGKDVSGAGLDPNVIGFWRRDGGLRQPNYRTLIALSLTPASGGNALGLGMVDLTTRRLIDQVNWEATYTNLQNTGIWRSVRRPMALEDDRAALTAALAHVPLPEKVRMTRIINTRELEYFWVTPTLVPELRGRSDLLVHDQPWPVVFDDAGCLRPFLTLGG